MFRSGFVSVVGRPNVGKSTLLNQIIGEKVSIISDKPQTTRTKIQLVYTGEDYQIVFLDTPGIQTPKNALGEAMLKMSRTALEDVDAILFLVDESEEIGRLDRYILETLAPIETPKILVINKTDLMSEEALQGITERYRALGFERIVPISALNAKNIQTLIDAIVELLPEGPKYFPDDMITDQPERLIISEIVREKALLHLSEEIPHGILVETERVAKREGKELVDVFVTLYVEKKSHKPIVIGKGGSMIKIISTEARHDIERLLGSKIYLEIHVKIAENWRKNEAKVKKFGYK